MKFNFPKNKVQREIYEQEEELKVPINKIIELARSGNKTAQEYLRLKLNCKVFNVKETSYETIYAKLKYRLK